MSIDELSETATRKFAYRFTRRGLVGRLGVALTAIGASELGFDVSVARAGGCPCSVCDGYSTSCGAGCPSGTCSCGSWLTCECSTRMKQWTDCCTNSCSQYCGSDGRPGCYYTHEYGSCANTIYCRVSQCTNLTC